MGADLTYRAEGGNAADGALSGGGPLTTILHFQEKKGACFWSFRKQAKKEDRGGYSQKVHRRLLPLLC